MNASHHRWLREQLPKWEHAGLVTAEAAQTLRERHAVDESQVGAAQIIMGSLGALLIGTGLIAVIGYNWDDFKRPVRLLFAFLPLLGSQIFSFIVLRKRSVAYQQKYKEQIFHIGLGLSVYKLLTLTKVSG